MPRFAIALAALLLSACAIPQTVTPRVAPASTSFASAPRVEVHLDSFSFAPRTISLTAGRPVVLVLVNDGVGQHNFSAPGFFAATQIAGSDASVITDGLVEVAPGARVELRLIPTAGGYDLECTHFSHSLRGMTGSIVVR